MKYFINVVNFVDKYLFVIVLLFLVACAIEFFVYLARRKSNGYFDTDGFSVCVATNLAITLGLYVLACLSVGFVNCIKAQDWHFWANYKEFLAGEASKGIFGFVFLIAAIVLMFVIDADSFVGKLIGAILGGALLTLIAVVAGFLLYVAVAIVIVVIKLVWFVFTGFFQSIFQFVTKYWRMSVTVLVGPGAIYGAICAFKNYIRSFRDEVIHR